MNKPTALFFSFFLFFNQSLCLDPYYDACVPRNCGDGSNISYPFYIRGLQDASCGYPGFELRCSPNGFPILRISENDFMVRNISYKNRSLQIQNSAILPNQTVSCPSHIRNITLDPNQFLIHNDSTSKLVLISNCFKNLTENLERYRIRSCQKSGELVMLETDANFRNVTEICGNGSGIVKTPVEVGGEERRSLVVDGENYADVMKRGFLMQWRAEDCGVCMTSGGRCGFNMSAFQFRCFCPNRPHMVSCPPEPGI